MIDGNFMALIREIVINDKHGHLSKIMVDYTLEDIYRWSYGLSPPPKHIMDHIAVVCKRLLGDKSKVFWPLPRIRGYGADLIQKDEIFVFSNSHIISTNFKYIAATPRLHSISVVDKPVDRHCLIMSGVDS